MTSFEINTRYSPEKLSEFGFVPVGVIVLGDTTFLFKKDKETLFALEPVDPATQRDYFKKQTERLNQKNYINIPGVDAVQVSFAQLSSKSQITANWIETTSGADKPEIHIPVTDPIIFDERLIELNEDVLRDLFLPKDARTKAATFFTMETADLEIIGIAIRGSNPKLLFLPAAVEGSRLSTITGLNNFLDAIYLRLIERTTQTQKQVDGGIFEASLPTKGQLVFSSEATKKSLAAAHKRLYQIQGLLIALRGDDRLGTQDPGILAHAPFLRTEIKQSGIAALLNKSQAPEKVIVDGTIWSNLNHAPGAGLIATGPRTARPAQIRPISVVTANRPEQVVRTPEPARQMTEKQKAMLLAKELDSGLNTALTMFKDYPVEALTLKQVQELGEKIEVISKNAEKYTSQRTRGKAPANPAPTRITFTNGSTNLAGIKDERLFAFMTGSQIVTDYKAKIDAGLATIQNTILPIMKSTSSRQERLLSASRSSRVLAKVPSFSDKLLPELDIVSNSVGKKDLYTAECGYILLASQVCYILWARYQELKSVGTEVEIDNWANYCYTTTNRLRQLASELISK